MNAPHVDECHSEHQPHPHTGERHGCITNSYGGKEWVPCPDNDDAGLMEAITLAIARADGQIWESLDDAPSRAAHMGYPEMARAAHAVISKWVKG